MAEDLNDAVEAGDRPMIMNVFCKMTAILAGIAMLGSGFADISDTSSKGLSAGQKPAYLAESVLLGDEQPDLYLPLLKGKRVALFSNQTGIAGNRIVRKESDEQETEEHTAEKKIMENTQGASDPGNLPEEHGLPENGADLIPFGKNADGTEVTYGDHILDVLVRQGVDVTAVFSPEHGFRGTSDAGAGVDDTVDEKTGIPIISLYGNRPKQPTAAELDLFDVLVVDIQDVGLRYYTYYITMYHLMDACAAAGKEVVIMDRPNPNGVYVDGPVLEEEFTSGVGNLPIPVVHGMTLGELARMINGEGWLSTGPDSCRLTVVPCQNYTHRTLTSLVMRPSPNLKDMRAVYLYASTCFFENTAFSVGRGTDHPFEIYGSPYLQDSFSFTPVSMEGAVSPPFEGQTCYGRDLRAIPLDHILQEKIDLTYLIEAYRALRDTRPDISFFGDPDGAGHYWIDYLFGTDRVRRMIEEGCGPEEIESAWQDEVEAFKEQRQQYLLYEE